MQPFSTVTARAVPFDNGGNGMSATDLQAAVEEIGSGAVSLPSDFINSLSTFIVALNKQFVLVACLTIEGTLDVSGTVGVL